MSKSIYIILLNYVIVCDMQNKKLLHCFHKLSCKTYVNKNRNLIKEQSDCHSIHIRTVFCRYRNHCVHLLLRFFLINKTCEFNYCDFRESCTHIYVFSIIKQVLITAILNKLPYSHYILNA